MSKFQSQWFKSSEDLVFSKNRARDNTSDRLKRLDIVRKFSNGLATMSEEEAKELGRSEITNHLTTYKSLQQQESAFSSMVSGTNALVEIIVDTDNAERDAVTSSRMSKVINEGAIHFKGKVSQFWDKVAGEIIISGGVPIVMPRKHGWMPEARPNMLFPPGTDLDPDYVPYAFDPTELSYKALQNLLSSVKSNDGSFIEIKNLKSLIKAIETQIEQRTDIGRKFEDEFENGSIREDGKAAKLTTISAWWYYEVKFDEEEPYVSATLFCEGLHDILRDPITHGKSELKDSYIIAYIPKAYKSPNDWLYLPVIDSEIGGVKTLDTVRGVAELVYPSGAELEELLNLMLEGDKIRAKPKFTVTNDLTVDSLLKFNPAVDTYFPKGVEEAQIRGSSAGLMTPFSILGQNASGLTGSPVSNNGRGGELRAQALERQQSSGTLQSNRISKAYDHLTCIVENMVYRLLTMPLKAGCEGYNEAKFIRAQLDKYGIDYKTLAKRKYGRFEFLRIRVKRLIGNGDRIQQIETANWFMTNIVSYPPESRPLIVHQATLLVSQDPDWTDRLVTVPQAIINAQRITAENEFDTIRRRAVLGQVLPIGVDDIDQDHIPSHLIDLQALIAINEVIPWTKIDALQFAGAVQHTGLHVQRLLGNPLTNPEGKQFLQQFQLIIQEATDIVGNLQEQEAQQGQQQLDPKDQMNFQIQMGKLQLEAQKFGFQIETGKMLEDQRQRRSQTVERGQFAKEISDNRRLNLEQERLQLDAATRKRPENTP